MSDINCKCGGKTNTALCDWVDNIDEGRAKKCYSKWENGRWVKGCAEDKGFMRNFADKTTQKQSLKCEVFDHK